MKYLSKFLFVISEAKVKLLILILIFVFSSLMDTLGIGLVGPFLWLVSHPESLHKITLLSWIYTNLGLNSNGQFITIVGLLLVAIFCIKSFLYFLARSYIYKFTFNQHAKLILRLLNGYLSIPYSFYLSRDTASLIQNIILETQTFSYQSLLPILESISNLTTTIFLILLVAKVNLLLFVMILGIILPIFFLFLKMKNLAKKWGQQQSEAYHEMIRIINHALGGVKETYVIGCQSYFEEQMSWQANKYSSALSNYLSFLIIPRLTIETIFIIAIVLFICISEIIFTQKIENIVPILSVFAVASIRLLPAVSQSLSAMGQLQAGSYALDMLYADLKNINNFNQASGIKPDSALKIPLTFEQLSKKAMSFSNSIDLKNVTYYYPGSDKAAIENISLTIKRGQSVAFIGKSGAGKTTLVDIILGLLESIEGDILIDGVSIYQNLRSWQNLIGYIPQSIFLIDDSIERNIAFGVLDHLIDTEKLDRAIRNAQLTELIEQLPDGIKTAVGERGVRLSGGQRQRIGIARALYHEREILVLDEATAALDNETESLLTEAVNSLSGMKTIIIIAHRLTTIKHCDCIYVMQKGRIVRSTTYNEVLLEEQALR